MKKVKYLTFYDISDKEGRCYALSAVNKADYVIGCLERLGYDVDIISASLTSSVGYIKGSETKLTDKVNLIKLPALKWGNKFQKLIAYIWSVLGLFFYLIFNVKRDEEIFAYHSLGFMTAMKWAKKIKKFKLTLEVEEIYNDVICKSKRHRNKEIKYISLADKYIFPTELLNKELNKQNKPYCIAHGTYKVEPDRKVGFADDKIHIVYAGTFDPRKGGAITTTTTTMLSENYHVHILGFGSDEDVKKMKKLITEVNEKSEATVTYDGLLSGDEYIKFIQKCHIGMSTQNPNAEFNATSFPSKVLSYMANGLRVVSVNIPAIYSSDVGKYLYYYENPTEKEIASAIMSVNFDDGYDGRKIIKELDKKFMENLERLL